MKKAIVAVVFVVPMFFVNMAFAQVLQWSSADGGNGHYYEKIGDSVSWLDAYTAANLKSYLGAPGYLVTLTSQPEVDFIVNHWEDANHGTGACWIGAYQYDKLAEPAGHWRWVTDEPWKFTNWYPGEPNDGNGLGNEDWAVFSIAPNSSVPGSKPGQYADWPVGGDPSFPARGYFVEYEPKAVPEPVSMVLFGLGGVAMAALKRKKKVL